MRFTKEEINEFSQEELFMWAEVLAREEKAGHIRKLMLEQLDIDEASSGDCNIIKLDSKVGD